MTRRVVFRPAAKGDLVALHHDITEHDSHHRAGAYIDRIENACMSHADFPFRGSLRDDLHPGVRIIGFERRASIAFLVEDDVVRILRIFYGGRDLPRDWTVD